MPKDLIAEYRKIAALGGNFRGLSVLNHADDIARLMAGDNVETMLDYGSGAGDQYKDPHNLHQLLGLSRLKVTLFDPAFKGIHIRPEHTFDWIVCSDVLEHMHEGQAQEAVYWMARHCRLATWASVCTRPAKKLFGDGTNMHVTVRPMDWWHDIFKAAFQDRHGINYWLVETP